MAVRVRQGNRLTKLFPRDLQGICKGFTGVLWPLHVLEDSHRANQVFNNQIMRRRHAVIANHPQLSCRDSNAGTTTSDSQGPDQLFSSGSMCLLNSSNEVSPFSISPLTKKVGVEFTFSTSLAYFWSAAILSSSV